MIRTRDRLLFSTMAMAACLAITSSAQAGGYAANGCVSKKDGALGKYAVAVSKAWVKYPSDMGARGAAITKAATSLDGTWTKEEAKATTKFADCAATTSSSADAATAVNDAITALGASDKPVVGNYIGAAMKAYAKYIKDPTKDPGKAKLIAALAAASAKYLATATVPVTTAANDLQAALIQDTTTAPNYADTFQTIAFTKDQKVNYGKDILSPGCVDGDPYMFFAKRGTSNNVVMYYQGGGACWSANSCFGIPGGGSICSRTADASDNPALTTTGFANYDDPANPFHDWSVVFVTYCTCDVHWGDSVTAYGGPGHTANHVGRENAAIAEKFAREHFMDPDRVFVTGSSAGSYGALFNSYFLMKNVWPNADFAVLGDAGVGVITQQFLDDYIDNWGLAKNFPKDLKGVTLPVQNLSLAELIDGLAQKFPKARFANYDSSYDGGGGSQSNFFQVMRHPTPTGSIISDWGNFWESTCDWNACMKEFKAANSSQAALPARSSHNYHYFTGAGSRHTIFGSDKIYTETKSTTAGGVGVRFVDWVQAMVDNTASWVDVDCNNLNGDCSLTNTCQGGTNAGGTCSSGADCPGGSCNQDPDTSNAPYSGDHHTVTCAPTTCPCGEAAGKCFDGPNEGHSCTKATAATDCPSGTCSWVKCPSFN